MDAEDLQFEFPCRLLLAFAAAIHWASAAIVWREYTLLNLEAVDVLAWTAAFVNALV